SGWPCREPGDVHPGAGRAGNVRPPAGDRSVELEGRQAEGECPRRLHVAGLPGRAARGHHGESGSHGRRSASAPEQLLRGQFQGLPVPPGVLSRPRDPELVRPGNRSAATAARRRRPRFVQMGAAWSPDGESLVFARAPATDPNPPGVPLAQFANDPGELQIKYDLYRIPFHNGLGGTAEPIAGASGNGMSNTFPKVSPDGRWIVFVECRNGELMRPDSQLYIV